MFEYLDSNFRAKNPNMVSFLDEAQYSLFYENGGLAKVQTPRGHFHTFSQKSSVGLQRFQYQGPWIQDPNLAFELMYNSKGQILRQR